MNRLKKLDGMKSFIRTIESFLEIIILTVAYYFVWRYAYYEASLFPDYFFNGKYVLSGVYLILVMGLFFGMDGFKFGHLRVTDVLLSQLLALFIANFITYWQLCLIANTVISPVPIVMLMVIEILIAGVCIIIFNAIYHKLYAPKNLAMIYGRDDAVTLKFKMETRPDKYNISKLISIDDGLQSICEQIREFDAVIINDVPSSIRNDVLKFCYENKIITYLTPKLTDIVVRGASKINLFDTPLFLVKGTGLTPAQSFLKRVIDLVFCIPALVIAAPIMLVIAIAIKLEDGGPVFYKQERVTLNDRHFKIIKFRSMVVDAEKNGAPQLASSRDPRITRVGYFIRATRLDELPQIFNIVKGDMSIVGPRPERPEYIDKFCEETPEFTYRTKVKGGLTGYAQVYGKYNTTPYDKLRLDMMYIENYTPLLDIKLILMTIRIIFKKESTEGIDILSVNDKKAEELLKNIRHGTEADKNDTKG